MKKDYAHSGTHTYNAVAKANAMFQARPSSRSSITKIMVIVTDGISSNTHILRHKINIAKQMKVIIWSIAVGKKVNSSFYSNSISINY